MYIGGGIFGWWARRLARMDLCEGSVAWAVPKCALVSLGRPYNLSQGDCMHLIWVASWPLILGACCPPAWQDKGL